MTGNWIFPHKCISLTNIKFRIKLLMALSDTVNVKTLYTAVIILG